MHNQTCRANHLGIWAAEPLWFRQAVAAVKEGTWKPKTNNLPFDVIKVDHKLSRSEFDGIQRSLSKLYGESGRKVVILENGMSIGNTGESPIYQTIDGVAVIPIVDFMMKGESKYGGTSTVKTRHAIRTANRDTSVSSILLHVDSPGGHHFGTDELSTEIRKSRKPVVSFIEDTGASAAYWAASSVKKGRVLANRTAEVGSIGTFAVLEDTSQMADNMGVKVHVVSTGPHKGAGVDGTPISDELLSEVQIAVNRAFGFFADSVKRGRDMGERAFAAVSDGRMFGAQEAVELGLIDAISTLEGAVDMARELGKAQNARSRVTGMRVSNALER